MSFIDIPIEVDEINLSIRGWEILDARTRFVEVIDLSGECVYKMAYSIRACYTPSDNEDSNVYLEGKDNSFYWSGSPGLQLEVEGPGGESQIVFLRRGDGPRWQENMCRAYASKKPLDISKSFKVSLTAVDEIAADDSMYMIPTFVSEIPVEIINESALTSVRFEFDKTMVNMAYGLWESQIDIDFRGRLIIGSDVEIESDFRKMNRNAQWLARKGADISSYVSIPHLSIEIMDETGFLLNDDEFTILGDTSVRKAADNRPVFTWTYRSFDDTEEMMGSPARVVVRIFDENNAC
ncbi:hypothetical protein [Corynebacterium ulcerans]|uniref:Immunity-specific protein beta201 n=1 Tax=Corynebacterium ulcerans TaxID=65058 RepID=A0ABD7MQ76_CORUL|nr:hypothetical protein [Corynebacterium ulcerans]QQU24950.1 hypothetical protein I6I75_06585 [Corynebacterium ulcerans]SNV07050.1 Uncharacterised protein [Corynebacterium ulcerans]SQG49872.1 Uncharacterised protein [Corynebacterium ulcerans]SQH03478.1 Uncharacterised protein [Corynebacterium ulcerans]